MPRFRYKAISPDGEISEGEMEAASEAAVIDRLREIGYLPVRARQVAAGRRGGGRRSGLGHTLSQTQVTTLTRELARLIGAGVSLDRALIILIEVSDSEPVKRLLTGLSEEIRGGATFAAALEAQGRTFSRLYVSMVRAGEEGGALEVVLERLADHLERSREFQASLKAALIYPVILLLVSVLSLILLLTLVVPQFQRMFDQAGAALPLPTQIVIAVADWMQAYWWTLLLGLLVLLLGVPKLLERPAPRRVWDRLLLSVWGIGPLVRRIEVGRFCRNLSTLLGNGVTLLTALSIVRETLSNSALAEAVDAVAERLKTGETLSGPMLETGMFPKLACHMVRVGEETGRLEEMLMDVAGIYDQEVQHSLKKMLSLLEPLLILFLGVLIAAIIFSILMALLSINELAF